MPVLDAVFVGKIHLLEVGGGPIVPPGQPSQPGVPTHPIYIPPSSPPGYWGGGPHPMPPIHYPEQPPAGQPPLGIWGGPWQPPYPSQGPGFPTHPIVLPPGSPPVPTHPWVPPEPHPEHPIVLPPDAVPPTMPPHPAHPIAGVEYGYALIYIPGYGMKWVAFPVHPDEAPPAA